MQKTWLAVVTACCLAAPAALRAASFNFSHIHCFKFKDTVAKAKYTADEVGMPGCVIKTPAKLVCEFTYKANVSPPTPGGGPDVPLNHSIFFCYKQKCPKLPISGTFTDQFGTHTVDTPITTSKLLCAPASASGAFLDGAALF